MPKKRASRNSVKKKPSRKPFIVYRHYIIALSVLLLTIGLFVFSRTQTFYFLVSTKEQVDFENATGEYDPKGTVAVFHDVSVPVPHVSLHTARADIEEEASVLGESTTNKRIEVDLTNQRLYAVENGTRVYDFPISSGKPWWATPTGYFKIWIKLRYTRMRGGSQALGTYYDLPNVPYTMFFYNDSVPKAKGYGIHGAYWHNNFGHPMSHGCINMKEEDVAQIYHWAGPDVGGKNVVYADENNPGTEVMIYGKTPSS